MKNTSKIGYDYMEKGKSEVCPIIDMHGHLGPYAGLYMPGAPLDIMRRTLNRYGVRKIVCTPHIGMMCNPEKGNNLMQKIIDDYPEQFLGYCIINPNFPEMTQKFIRNFKSFRGFIGFKFWPDYHLHPVNGKAYIEALEYANSQKLTILIHTWGGSEYNSPLMVGEVAKKYPNINILMGHSGFGEWENAVKSAKDYENLYLELTAVYASHDFTLQPYGSGAPIGLMSYPYINGVIEYMVENAGSEKIVFGTDMPWYSPLYGAGAILFSHISEEDR
ncbi:MAG: amidohydrolase family protein, partial [Actinobacteria bacterium]|nr:amidohydrolase family protein [Actinomycetota bacterium]